MDGSLRDHLSTGARPKLDRISPPGFRKAQGGSRDFPQAHCTTVPQMPPERQTRQSTAEIQKAAHRLSWMAEAIEPAFKEFTTLMPTISTIGGRRPRRKGNECRIIRSSGIASSSSAVAALLSSESP